MSNERELFARMNETIIDDPLVSDAAFRLAAHLQRIWHGLGRPTPLPYSLREISGMLDKEPAAVKRTMDYLIKGGYVSVTKADRHGASNTYFLTEKLTGGLQQNYVKSILPVNAGLGVMSSCSLDVIHLQLRKSRLDSFFPIFQTFLQRSPLSTEDVLSVVRSFARKFARVESGHDTFGPGGSVAYLKGALKGKFAETSNPTNPSSSSSSSSSSNKNSSALPKSFQPLDAELQRLEELAQKLNNGDLVSPSELSAGQLADWVNGNHLRFEGQFVVGVPSVRYVPKHDIRKIVLVQTSQYVRQTTAKRSAQTQSIADTLDSLNAIPHTPHIVLNTEAKV